MGRVTDTPHCDTCGRERIQGGIQCKIKCKSSDEKDCVDKCEKRVEEDYHNCEKECHHSLAEKPGLEAPDCLICARELTQARILCNIDYKKHKDKDARDKCEDAA